MVLLTEQEQIDILRNKCDNVKNRLWIASPYIGTLKDVQRIIGGKWQLPSVDCRVLTDADSGSFSILLPEALPDQLKNYKLLTLTSPP